MGEKNDKAPSDFLLDLLTSDMNLARAFTAVSRAAYQMGKLEEGDFARLKAIQLYSEAARLVTQVPDAEKDAIGYELQALNTTINWLFMQSRIGAHAAPAENQKVPIETPPIALEEN
jgi:hypothetical protein